MATKQKYYVLENGEYVVKYKDAPHQTLKNKLSPDRSARQDLQKYMTPKSARNTTSFNIDSHSFGNKRLQTNRKFIVGENEEMDKSGYSQCMTDKQPDERLCHITLQLTSRIKKLEEENQYLQQQNKHFAIKLSLNIQKQSEYKQNIKDLENQLQEVKYSYEQHMKMYNELCVAYEGLAEENKKLLDETRIRQSKAVSKTNSKTRSQTDSQQLQSVSEDGESTFRTHNPDDVLHKSQFKIQRYMFELDLLKHQIMDKDMELGDVLNQLRVTEANLNNSKLTQDFLITELEKTKAICYNQKLLEEALNEKITRIMEDLKDKQSIIGKICQSCHQNIVQNYEKSTNKNIEATKMDSDSDQNIN